ncbi:MAG TPA: hypothetical protein VHV57_12215 [Acidimicrobiales bacterium]|nr:hypothetical protein [Acidimicrobiales bacterium]
MTNSLATYPAEYDEIFWEIHDRLLTQGHATKLDLGGLVFWKHIQNAPWMTDLNGIPDIQVTAASAAAFAPNLTDSQRIAALAPLPGYRAGGAFTSVVLTAWNPDQYGVFDKLVYAHFPTVIDARCACDWTYLPEYFDHLRRLAQELTVPTGVAWTPRRVDMALLML